MNQEKLNFLKNDFLHLLKDLSADAKGKWGKMNGQQMVEHVSGFFAVSYEKLKFPLVTSQEHLPKYKEFLMSEKEFRENTKAPAQVLPDEPIALRNSNMEEAMKVLEKSLNNFFIYFSENPDKKTLHPVFGELNFAEWVQLHHKHVTHHLKQFGLIA
jgi:oxepin-CoA hydrolase/3-oxo-5,6-dehydrosuberyl-CoA semialdehyde dehydrogenase